MKTTITTFFILILGLTISAQKKMTDREFDGFQGNVKSVSIESMPISGSADVKHRNKRTVWELWSYDKDGRKTEEYNPQAKSKVIFSLQNGSKTSKFIEGKGGSSESFNFRYVYEYDSQGRVKTEKIYLNNNQTSNLKTFEYDEKGRIIERIDNDPDSITKVVYKYNSKGNLTEKLEEQKGKGEFGTDSISRTVYSNYKVDAHGNWTERKSSLYYGSESGDGGHPYVSMEYRVFTYHQS